MKEITFSDALAQGYTHFRMGTENDLRDEFQVIPLSKENFDKYTLRGVDEAFDNKCNEGLDGDLVNIEYYFGMYPILLEKPKYPSITAGSLVELLVEHNELEPDLVPASLQEMGGALSEEEDFKKGLELINKAMMEFKTWQDANIKVLPDA